MRMKKQKTKEKQIVHNPHDTFIKKVFQKKEEAVDFLMGSLPEELKLDIDFDTIEPAKESFIDKRLKKSYSDIIFNATLKQENQLKIAFIIEHKSYKPRNNVRIQLLEYFISLVKHQIEQKQQPLALPILVLFYHGKEKFKDEPLWKLFGKVPEHLRKYIPDFVFILVELPDEDKIKTEYKSLPLRAVFYTLKGLVEILEIKEAFGKAFSELMQISDSELQVEFAGLVLQYIESVSVEKHQIAEEVIENIKTKGVETMTIIDKAIEKGRQEGRQEGIGIGVEKGIGIGVEKGKQLYNIEGILKMLKLKFPNNLMYEFSELSEEIIHTIKDLYEKNPKITAEEIYELFQKK